MTERCACPSIDARLCAVMRYGESVDGERIESCECPCHDVWEANTHRDTDDWWVSVTTTEAA